MKTNFSIRYAGKHLFLKKIIGGCGVFFKSNFPLHLHWFSEYDDGKDIKVDFIDSMQVDDDEIYE